METKQQEIKSNDIIFNDIAEILGTTFDHHIKMKNIRYLETEQHLYRIQIFDEIISVRKSFKLNQDAKVIWNIAMTYNKEILSNIIKILNNDNSGED